MSQYIKENENLEHSVVKDMENLEDTLKKFEDKVYCDLLSHIEKRHKK